MVLMKTIKLRRRKTDSFRERVYNWEASEIHTMDGGEVMTLEECQKLVDRVWKSYYPWARPPKVSHKGGGYGKRGVGGWATRDEIRLANKHKSLVLHEVTHSILAYHRADWMNYAPHGPEFMRLYINILARYYRLPAGPIRASARKAGLRVAQNSAIPIPRRKRNGSTGTD